MSEEHKTSWVDWVWRLLGGGTILSVIVVLVVTMFNQQSNNLNNLNSNITTIKGDVGQVQSDIKNNKESTEHYLEFSKEISKGYKQADTDLQKQIQECKERIIRLEEKIKTLH